MNALTGDGRYIGDLHGGRMKDQNVRVDRLDPMWVASIRVTGENPERDALAKIRAWAASKGFLEDRSRHPIFGFDNPPFGRRDTSRGYEVWIRIDDASDADPAVELKRFDGGRYAVTRCEVRGDPWEEIPPAWEDLAGWVRVNGHRLGSHQALELHLDFDPSKVDLALDLYCPISG